MVKKQKTKLKIKKFQIILILILIIFALYLLIRPKNYEISYEIDNIKITENYNSKKLAYTFTYQIDNYEFKSVISHKYIHRKKLIKDVEIVQNDNTLCLILNSSKLETYPLCNENNEYLSHYLLTDKSLLKEEYFLKQENNEVKYDNLSLYNIANNRFLIWDYQGFYLISAKDKQKIDLFDEDIYSIPLATKVDKYLIIPNYNEKYNFTKFFVIDSTNGKVRELNLKNPISYESYILGTENKRVYLVDKKNQKEYEIYPKRLLIENIIKNNRGRIYQDNDWQSITLNKLISSENTFTKENTRDFIIENQNLYEQIANYKVLIAKNVQKIINIDKDYVYYLKEDKLYKYNHYEGEILLIQNFEWNFNNDNMIFIY